MSSKKSLLSATRSTAAEAFAAAARSVRVVGGTANSR